MIANLLWKSGEETFALVRIPLYPKYVNSPVGVVLKQQDNVTDGQDIWLTQFN